MVVVEEDQQYMHLVEYLELPTPEEVVAVVVGDTELPNTQLQDRVEVDML